MDCLKSGILNVQDEELEDENTTPTPENFHSNLIRNIFSAELVYRKEQRCPLYDIFEYFKGPKRPGALEMSAVYPTADDYMGDHESRSEKTYSLSDFEEWIETKSPGLLGVLKRHPHNLFIAGGALVSYFRNSHNTHDFDYADIDVFLVANTTQEAEEIASDFAFCMEGMFAPEMRFYFHHMVMTWEWKTCQRKNVQLIRRLYTSPDQVCLGFDLWACQLIYGVELGLKCTLMGLYSITYGIFPLDPSKRSTSAHFRELRYINLKRFVMTLPGLPKGQLLNMNNFSHFEPVFEMRSDTKVEHYMTKRWFQITEFSDYDQDYEEDESNEEHWTMWWHVLQGHVVTLKLSSYEQVKNFDLDNTILKMLFLRFFKVEAHRRKYDFLHLKQFFEDERDWVTWSTKYFVERQFEAAETFWYENLLKRAAYLKDTYSDLTKLWKVKNPGEQRFGQNRPTPMTGLELYGPNYVPFRVGMSHEVYVLFRRWQYENAMICGLWMPKDLSNHIVKTYLRLCEADVLSMMLK